MESGDDVVILEGKVQRIVDRKLLSRLDEIYFRKYAFHLAQEDGGSVYSLRHRLAFAWFERDFIGSATKYRFQD